MKLMRFICIKCDTLEVHELCSFFICLLTPFDSYTYLQYLKYMCVSIIPLLPYIDHMIYMDSVPVLCILLTVISLQMQAKSCNIGNLIKIRCSFYSHARYGICVVNV